MTLVSPGTDITVIDQSINAGAPPGTVPLIFIATAENKTDPSGTAIAPGTIKANAGLLYSITSQRDLVTTFGNPTFASVSGTAKNAYPLNEYGLLAAYSYLGISNLARIVRADIDTSQLEATPISPTSPAAVGTYWLDESAIPTGSSYGLFIRSGTSPNQIWVSVSPKFVYNFLTGTTNTPVSGDGVNGDFAVVFQTVSGNISYWTKASGAWHQLGTTGYETIISSVWPDIGTGSSVTEAYWVKASSAAQGTNFVVRKMDATAAAFLQKETPILANDSAANTYYSTLPTGSNGQLYIQPVITASASAPNSFIIKQYVTSSSSWALLGTVIGSSIMPTAGPAENQLWYNSLIGLDSTGKSTVDILMADGQGHWGNINLPGFTISGTSGKPTLYVQSLDPRDNTITPTLIYGDIWVDTDQANYPVMYRWNTTAWVLVNKADQTSPLGILFEDARPSPLYHNGSSTGVNNGGGSGNPDLDPDAPNAALYPRGFLLWNTRYSTNNVKEWKNNYTYNGVAAAADNTNNGSLGRWVTTSGNDASGIPYMGSDAQQIVVANALNAAIISNEDVRAEDTYFNLIATPGYVETSAAMVSLNDDRKNTAFVVGDTSMTLPSNATSLQAYATNHNGALTDNENGMVTSSKYFGAWYPSGLAPNTDGVSVVVPPSHMALRTIAYNDQVAYPWFAPAGLQRGVVSNATSVGYVNTSGQFVETKLSEGQRDILYQNNINPIRVMPQGGIVIFGQKTRQLYSSATDRINVVRLENYIRYQLNILVQPFLFEPNDSITRAAAKDAVDRFMSELVTLRGITDWLCVVDTSNNTPARIDAHTLYIDLAFIATQSIEFIYIPIRIMNTGASLTNQ